MSIPFDADWRRLCTASDTPAALTRWGLLELALAGQDLDGIRCRARSHNPDVSDPVLASLLRLGATDRLARRVIVEALMGRLVPIAAGLARHNGDPYDDVLAELAGWAWELATVSAGRWSTQLASNLARLARRRYLSDRRHSAGPQVGDHQLPDRRGDAFDHPLGACDVDALLSGAVTAGTITPTGARVLATLVATDGTDRIIARHLGRSPAAIKKARERAVAQLRTWPPAAALRAA